MKKLITLSLISASILFHGCGGGGGGGGGSSSSSSSRSISGTLIDSEVAGVSYSCGTMSGITNNSGGFTCPANSTVTFTVGGITLGSTSLSSASSQTITPATLFELPNGDITDKRVLNFIRLVQSLDDDNDPTNGINITSTTHANLSSQTLNLDDLTVNDTQLTATTTADAGKTLKDETTALNHYKNTLTVDLNETLPTKEPLYNTQWALAQDTDYYTANGINNDAHIKADNTIYDTYTGKGIKIAVIDDGIDTSHEDLNGIVVKTYSALSGTTDASQTGNERHGTAVTGIISAKMNGIGIRGIAPKAEVMVIKLSGYVTAAQTIDAFEKAADWKADIINCSWGTGNVSSAVKSKIEDIADNGRDGKGTIIVFASGNGGDDKIGDDMGNDEGNIEKVLSVGSTNKDNDRSEYSNYGTNLDILAPGGYSKGITTTNPKTFSNKYAMPTALDSFQGTSAAAPVMSGIVALMLEKNPALTRVEVENLIKDNADQIGTVTYDAVSGSAKANWHANYAHGKVNVKAIMDDIVTP